MASIDIAIAVLFAEAQMSLAECKYGWASIPFPLITWLHFSWQCLALIGYFTVLRSPGIHKWNM